VIEIKEYLGHLEQGYAEAFLCRGDDGRKYVVKSRQSGRESLIREWVCGHIGRELGLPVPPFDMVHAASSIAEFSGIEEMAALADSPGFGSRFVMTTGDSASTALPVLNVADVAAVDVWMRRRVLLFDWWILNFDRTDDNPNLLWDPLTRDLHVIDHNLAFDSDPVARFWSGHIFRGDRALLSDPGLRASNSASMHAIIHKLPEIWSNLPESWTDASQLTLARVETMLHRYEADDFWSQS